MKKSICLLCTVTLSMTLVAGCYGPYGQPTRTGEGAAVGAVVGGTAGVLFSRRHPWRGGIIGGVLGAIAGATLADISERAAMEAARTQQPAEYRTEDGRGLYRAEPMDYNATTRCRKVRERVWEDGQLIRDGVKEVCTSEMNQRGY